MKKSTTAKQTLFDHLQDVSKHTNRVLNSPKWLDESDGDDITFALCAFTRKDNHVFLLGNDYEEVLILLLEQVLKQNKEGKPFKVEKNYG